MIIEVTAGTETSTFDSPEKSKERRERLDKLVSQSCESKVLLTHKINLEFVELVDLGDQKIACREDAKLCFEKRVSLSPEIFTLVDEVLKKENFALGTLAYQGGLKKPRSQSVQPNISSLMDETIKDIFGDIPPPAFIREALERALRN